MKQRTRCVIKNSSIDKVDACRDDIELRIFSLFQERPLTSNLLVLANIG